MAKRLKRPRDPVQLAKLIGDIATGRVEDALQMQRPAPDEAIVMRPPVKKAA